MKKKLKYYKLQCSTNIIYFSNVNLQHVFIIGLWFGLGVVPCNYAQFTVNTKVNTCNM